MVVQQIYSFVIFVTSYHRMNTPTSHHRMNTPTSHQSWFIKHSWVCYSIIPLSWCPNLILLHASESNMQYANVYAGSMHHFPIICPDKFFALRRCEIKFFGLYCFLKLTASQLYSYLLLKIVSIIRCFNFSPTHMWFENCST